MQFLSWRLERVGMNDRKPTRVHIELRNNRCSYDFDWVVSDRKARALSKREFNELEMRVSKYVESYVNNNDLRPHERSNFFAKL